MRNRYNEQLKELNDELILMGDLCKAGITYAVSSLKNPSDEIKEKVTEIENEINHKKYVGQSVNIIARWQAHRCSAENPTAQDAYTAAATWELL